MAIVGSAEELGDQTYDDGDTSEKVYVRVFRVRSDSPTERPNAVLAASGIPAAFEAHPDDSAALCRKRQVRQGGDDDRLRWYVTCTYSNKYEDPSQGGEPNPLARPLRIDPIVTEFDIPQERDREGTPYANSAGAKYDPPYTQTIGIPGIVFRRNVATFNVPLAVQYKNSINSSTFYGRPAKTVLCKSITWSELQFENEVNYREERIEVWFFDYPLNPVELLDAGFYEFFAPLAKPRVITDEDGNNINAPALLDGTGRLLGEGEDPVYNQFIGFDELPFAVLNLE